MQYTPLKKRKASAQGNALGDARVYARLDELVRLRFKASGFSFLPRQPVHSVLSGKHASRLRGRGLNFEELRHYLPGDDIRSIDWRVTARTREPHVRVYTEERDRTVWLLVDQRISMFFGSRWKMKSVMAAEATAVSAWRVLAAGDRVGAVIFNDENIDIIEPHRSSDRVMHILRKLVDRNHELRADLATAPQPDMLNLALRKLRELARHDCLVTIISDGLGIDEASVKDITGLSQHNDILAVFIYDPLEQSLPDAGRLVFSDPGGQLEVNTASLKLRDDFRMSFKARIEQLKTASRKHAIPVLTLSTDTDALAQVKRQLGHISSARRG